MLVRYMRIGKRYLTMNAAWLYTVPWVLAFVSTQPRQDRVTAVDDHAIRVWGKATYDRTRRRTAWRW